MDTHLFVLVPYVYERAHVLLTCYGKGRERPGWLSRRAGDHATALGLGSSGAARTPPPAARAAPGTRRPRAPGTQVVSPAVLLLAGGSAARVRARTADPKRGDWLSLTGCCCAQCPLRVHVIRGGFIISATTTDS